MPIPSLMAQVDLARLEDLLARPGKAVVAVQSLNSETGTFVLTDQGETAATVRAAGGLLLVRLFAIGRETPFARLRHGGRLGAQIRRADRHRCAAGA